MRRQAPFAAAALLLAGLGGLPALAGGLAIEAEELHLGDERVLIPGLVLVENGRIRAFGDPGSLRVPSDFRRLQVRALLPGLVGRSSPAGASDARSVDPARRALDLFDRQAPTRRWLEAGITALSLSPGSDRLVSGRGAVVRLLGDGARTELAEGPVHASLEPSSLTPPRLFEPSSPVNVNHPLSLARPQRPTSPAAALAVLRRLLGEAQLGLSPSEGGEAFRAVVARRVPLVIHAHREAAIRDAVGLATEFGFMLIVEGATEAWKLAAELAAVDAAVVLTGAGASLDDGPAQERGEFRPDLAARLEAAGVRVSFAPEAEGPESSPLLVAGAAVRAGLSPAAAIAALTGRAAAAAGAPELGMVRRGAPADLVGFDAPPLALNARPVLVLVAGDIRFEAETPPDESSVLVLRAGSLRTSEGLRRAPRLVLRDGKLAGIGEGSAAPAGARVLDFGPDSVVVPGFIDAFSYLGLEPGARPPGSARIRGADAVELDSPSLGRARAAGISSALAVPAHSGSLAGRAQLVSTSPLPPDAEADRRREALDEQDTPQIFVFQLDGGPADGGARSGREKSLADLLKKAKGYHDTWEKHEKKDEAAAGEARGGKAGRKKAAGSRPRLEDVRNRPGRVAKGGAKPGAKTAAKTGGKAKPAAPAPDKDPELEPWWDLFRGRARAFLRAGRHDSILEGLDAFRAVGLSPTLVGAEEADVVADELAKRKVGVILAPPAIRRDGQRRINVAAELRAKGIPVAFGSMAPEASDRLPLAASRAVRLGLAPEDALAALTSTAAELLGAEGLGRLHAGDRADLVVFSADPFEPTSRILAVVVRGRLVHEWGDDLSGLGP